MAEQRHLDEGIHAGEGAGRALKRRGILAAAGTVVAGLVAKQASEPVAADGTFVAPGNNTAGGVTTLQYTGATLGSANILTVADATDFSSSFPAALAGYAEGGKVRYGVYGFSDTLSGAGVEGAGSVDVDGVRGESSGFGTGVRGHSNGSAGLNGSYGVYGTTGAGVGVRGNATGAGMGVYGTSFGGNGVYGFAQAAGTTQVVAGVYGTSNSTYGILGNTTASGYSGLTAITGTTGVAALAATSTNANAYAAYFQGTTVVQGNFAVVGGSKSAAVKDATGQHRLVYCVESPEAWFEDFGKGALVGGKADVALDKTFAEIVHADDYGVFLTPEGDCKGLYVTGKTATGFTVRELQGGASALPFRWRVVAKRKDIVGERLAKFEVPKINHPDPDKLPKPEPPKKA